MDNLSKFKLYTLFKSTAIVTPILPIYLSETLLLNTSEIVYYSSFFYILPFLFEIPTGILSDKIGSKRCNSLGIIALSIAFFGLLIPEKNSYLNYLFFITLSGCLLSGSDSSLLFQIVGSQDIHKIKAQIDQLFYGSTSLMLLLSSILYLLDPHIPIIMQCMLLFTAYICLSHIAANIKKKNNNKTPSIIGGIHIRRYIIPLIIFSGILSFCLNLNARTVQIHMYTLDFSINIITIGFVFFIGNLISTLGIFLYKKNIHKSDNIGFMILIITIGFSLSFIFMSIDSRLFVITGFLLICFIKPIFRSYISSTYISLQEKEHSIASTLSIYQLISSLIVTVASFAYAMFFTDFQSSNLFISFSILVVGIPLSILYHTHPGSKKEILFNTAVSDKKHFIKRNHTKLNFIQQYPSKDCINSLIYDNNQFVYNHPKLIKESERELVWEYVKGTRLSDLSRNDQLNYIKRLASIQKNFAKNSSFDIIVHNDLHPHNILISNNKYYVIDWDLCAKGEIDNDVLSLFTSPFLNISFEERLSFISDTLSISNAEAKATTKTFISNKIFHLKMLDGHEFIKHLISKYSELMRANCHQ